MIMLAGCSPILWTNKHADVSGAIGAGFAGMSEASITNYPAYSPCQSCNTPTLVPVADSIDLISSKHHVYRPALSSGIVFHYFPNEQLRRDSNAFTLGVGAHIAFVPDVSGKTSPFPAVTFHFGSRSNEFFLGFLLTSNDEVQFPGPLNQSGGFRVGRTNPPNFSVSSSGHFWKNLYLGLQIGGRRQGESQAREASGDDVDDIELKTTSASLTAGDSTKLTITLLDQSRRVLNGRAVSVESDNRAIARVGSDWMVRTGSDTGTVRLTAKSGAVVRSTTIVVKAKPQ